MKNTTRVQRKRKRRFRFLKIISFIIIGAIVIFYAPFFELKTIYVNENKKISKNTIIESSKLEYGKNIFKLNLKKAKTNIENNVYIKEAKIKRKLLSSIDISVTERSGILQVHLNGQYYLIDEEGFILETSNSKFNAITVINGFNMDNLNDIKSFNEYEAYRQLEDFAKNSHKNKLLEEVEEIYVVDDKNLKLILINKTIVDFGFYDDSDYKIKFLKESLKEIEENQINAKMIKITEDGKLIVETAK